MEKKKLTVIYLHYKDKELAITEREQCVLKNSGCVLVKRGYSSLPGYDCYDKYVSDPVTTIIK